VSALRDAKLNIPVIVINGEDVGQVVAANVLARRN